MSFALMEPTKLVFLVGGISAGEFPSTRAVNFSGRKVGGTYALGVWNVSSGGSSRVTRETLLAAKVAG